MSNIPSRSLRLTGFDSTFLNRIVGSKGEIFYDQTNGTLRIMDGAEKGGQPLSAGAAVSETPPTTPQKGQLWIRSSTGVLYMWYVDDVGGQWVQPVADPVGSLTDVEEYDLPIATTLSLGGVKINSSSISIDANGVISALYTSDFTDPVFLGISTIELPAGTVDSFSSSTGELEHNVSESGTIFYHESPASNFVPNFTNLPITNNRSTTLTLVLNQDTAPYIAENIKINGASVSVTWINGITPTGTANNIDTIYFTALRINDEWSVMGSLTTQGVA